MIQIAASTHEVKLLQAYTPSKLLQAYTPSKLLQANSRSNLLQAYTRPNWSINTVQNNTKLLTVQITSSIHTVQITPRIHTANLLHSYTPSKLQQEYTPSKLLQNYKLQNGQITSRTHRSKCFKYRHRCNKTLAVLYYFYISADYFFTLFKSKNILKMPWHLNIKILCRICKWSTSSCFTMAFFNRLRVSYDRNLTDIIDKCPAT